MSEPPLVLHLKTNSCHTVTVSLPTVEEEIKYIEARVCGTDAAVM